MPLWGNAEKDRLAQAEEEAEQQRSQASEIEQQHARARQELAVGRQRRDQYARERAHAQARAAEAAAKTKSAAEELESARAEHRALVADLEAAETVRAAAAEASAATQRRIERLTALRGALRASAGGGEGGRPLGACEGVATEANERAAKAREPLQAAVVSSSSKAAVLTMETEVWRHERRKLDAALEALEQQHGEARAQHEATLAAAAAAGAEAEALRLVAAEARGRLEAQRLDALNLQERHAEAVALIDARCAQIEAVGSTYHGEVERLVPVIELTKGLKREADASQGQRLFEIQASTQSAREKRHSRDATLSDHTPGPTQATCLAPYYTARDVSPALKTKEWYKVGPSSTGIFLPNNSASEKRANDFSLFGRMVVTEKG